MSLSEKNIVETSALQAAPYTDNSTPEKSAANPTSSSGLRQRVHLVTKQDIDDTTLFYNRHKDDVEPIKPDEERRLNRKNFWFLLMQTWWVAFLIHLDKSTLSQASTMGIFRDVKMSKSEYNDLFVLFYAGYLIALWPGAALAQRVGHKQFITGSLLLWALLLGMHPLVKTGKQMMGLRFILGMVRNKAPMYSTLCLVTFTHGDALPDPNRFINNRPNPKSCRRPRCCTKPSFLRKRVPGSSCSGGRLAASPTSS